MKKRTNKSSVKTKSMICGIALAIVAAGVGFIMGTSRSTGSSNLLLRHQQLSSSSPEDDSLQRDHHDVRALKQHRRNNETPPLVTKDHYLSPSHTYKNMHSVDMHSVDSGKSGKSGYPWGKKYPSHYDNCLSGKSGKSGYSSSEGKSGKSGPTAPSEGKSGKSGGEWTASPSITHRMLNKKKKKKKKEKKLSGKSGGQATASPSTASYHLFVSLFFVCVTNDMYMYYLQS